MSWNYRVIEKKEGDTTVFAIHEVYYSENGDSVTVNNVAPYGDTLEELRGDLRHMVEALNKPVMKYEEFK